MALTPEQMTAASDLLYRHWQDQTRLDTLPDDLKKIIRDDADKVSREITPFVKKFFDDQEKIYVEKGGTISNLPKDEFDGMIKKVSSIGDDLSKSKPGLNKVVNALFEAAARHK